MQYILNKNIQKTKNIKGGCFPENRAKTQIGK